MKPCPNCAVTGRISIRPVLAVQPTGSYSLAGAQDKLAAATAAVAACGACDWSVTGWRDNVETAPDGTFISGHFVTDQPVPRRP